MYPLFHYPFPSPFYPPNSFHPSSPAPPFYCSLSLLLVIIPPSSFLYIFPQFSSSFTLSALSLCPSSVTLSLSSSFLIVSLDSFFIHYPSSPPLHASPPPPSYIIPLFLLYIIALLLRLHASPPPPSNYSNPPPP